MCNNDNGTYEQQYLQKLSDGTDLDLLLSAEGFEEFKLICPQLSEINLSEWRKMLQQWDEDKDKEEVTPLGFVSPSRVGNLAASVIGGMSAQGITFDPSATMDKIMNSAADNIRTQIRARVQARVAEMSGGISDVGDGGDGGTSKDNYAGGTPYNAHGLSLNAKPVQSSFRTGIVPLYRPKLYLDGKNNNAPLILKINNVFPELSSSAYAGSPAIQNYLDNRIVAGWINVVSTKVRLNTFTSGLMTKEHIFNYYATQHYCLGVLYFYDSVIQHFKMETNRNDAMIALYKSLDVEDLQNLSILRQLLDEIPLDPTVNQFAFHLYGNYKQSMLPGSPLVKFMPMAFNSSTDNNFTTLNSGVVTKCFKLLQNKKFRDFQQVFVQAFPETINTKTYYATGAPDFDADWVTCWVNATYSQATATSSEISVPRVGDDSTEVLQLLHTDAPDGWIDAASSIYNTTTGKFSGGYGGRKTLNIDNSGDAFPSTASISSGYLNSAGTQDRTSCYIYATDVNNAGNATTSFFPIGLREKYQILSGNTYKLFMANNTVSNFQRFGTEIALPKTIRDNIPIAQQFADYMYSPYKFAGGKTLPNTMSTIVGDDIAISERPKRPRRRRSRK